MDRKNIKWSQLSAGKNVCCNISNINQKLRAVIEKNPSKSITVVFWGWFALTICSGWILDCFISPPEFFINIYSSYIGHIKEYNLFCMSMLVAVLTFPMAFFLLFHALLKIVKKTPLRVKVLLIMMASVMVVYTTGIDGVGSIDRGGRTDPRVLVTQLFDWQGAVLLSLFFFAFFIYAVIVSLKPKRN